jgi:hypothetical protein
LYIWAQPATTTLADPYDVTTNRFQTLQNFSLNIVETISDGNPPIIDFVDGTFEVYNPTLDGSSRYEYPFDSLTPEDEFGPLRSAKPEAAVVSGEADSIIGLQGFSLELADFAGLGHSPNHPTAGCHPADTFCATTNDGSPAWLVGAVSLKTLASSGTASIHLQICTNGMTDPDLAQASAVTFGVNSTGVAPTYDSRMATHRGVTLEDDDPDAIINVVAAVAGDFNGDAVVDAADYIVWRDGLGTIYTPEQYNVWRANFGAPGDGASLSAANSVPEPSSLVIVLGSALLATARRRSGGSHLARSRPCA